ncbi:MAG: GTPase Era [Clostridia bacterium]|nr:GTPase Era [Clostridia bacterium]
METKSAFISIIGRANVGKSSFLNKALGQKVSIVSNKPQTTRTKIMGVKTIGNSQLVFIDTPGFHKPKNILGEKMIKAVSEGITGIDAALLIVEAVPRFKFDSNNLPQAELELIETLKKQKIPTVLGINKIDLLENKEELLTMINAYAQKFDFSAIVPFSAKSGNGVDIIINEALKFTTPSAHFFAADDITDQPDSVMVAELIREKLLRTLSSEVPHGIAVTIDRFFERDNKQNEPILEVEATIFCEKDSHKGIIIGKNGVMLKNIGTKARIDIEKFFGIKTNLKLWVKVKEDWRNRQSIIHTLGLD